MPSPYLIRTRVRRPLPSPRLSTWLPETILNTPGGILLDATARQQVAAHRSKGDRLGQTLRLLLEQTHPDIVFGSREDCKVVLEPDCWFREFEAWAAGAVEASREIHGLYAVEEERVYDGHVEESMSFENGLLNPRPRSSPTTLSPENRPLSKLRYVSSPISPTSASSPSTPRKKLKSLKQTKKALKDMEDLMESFIGCMDEYGTLRALREQDVDVLCADFGRTWAEIVEGFEFDFMANSMRMGRL